MVVFILSRKVSLSSQFLKNKRKTHIEAPRMRSKGLSKDFKNYSCLDRAKWLKAPQGSLRGFKSRRSHRRPRLFCHVILSNLFRSQYPKIFQTAYLGLVLYLTKDSVKSSLVSNARLRIASQSCVLGAVITLSKPEKSITPY